MNSPDIIYYRLINQQIATTKFKLPQEIVKWMVAMQAQEFAHAKWAIGLRLNQHVKDTDVESAFNDGSILRTHLMRPTWHFVAPSDIRWLLALTAPRVHAANAYMYKKLELTSKLIKKSSDLISKALEGNKYLNRMALQTWLMQNKIKADGLRLGYMMMHAELDGLICSGPRQGKQFTYALIDERVPAAKKFNREEALATFAERYFASRGPATLKDFSYWSGLTVKEVKEGAALLPNHFVRKIIDDQEYIYSPALSDKVMDDLKKNKMRTTFLMPDYDEYGMSYKDRRMLTTTKITPRFENASVYSHWLVVDGRIEGTWTRAENKKVAAVATPFAPLTKIKQQAVQNAAKRYNAFVK